MKLISFLTGMLLLSQFLFSQKVVENPKVEFNSAIGVEITKIELTDSFTICWFTYSSAPGSGYMIPSLSYILPEGESDKLFLVKADNVKIDQWDGMPSTGKTEFTLYFPAIDPDSKKIEFGEANEGGNWFIYGISLVEEPYSGLIPEALTGYWYNANGSKELMIALFDTVAVFDNQVWAYDDVDVAEKLVKIQLSNNNGKRQLEVNSVDESTIMLGTAKGQKIKLCNQPITVAGYSNPTDKVFTAPVISANGKAIYKGFIRNYNTKYITARTGQVYVNNVLTGNQTSHTVRIQNDGTFSIELPIGHPVQIYAQMPMCYEAIFVEPGKETFHIISPNDSERNYFMGEMAAVNNGLMALKNIRYYDYQKVQDSILSYTPEQFMAYCFDVRDRELKDIKAYGEANYLHPKVFQIKQRGVNYSALSNTMEYKWNYESAYRQKNNIQRNQRDVKIDIPVIDTSLYYSIINNDLLNDPLAPISNDYGSYINRVKFSDILMGRIFFTHTVANLEKLVNDAGIRLTDEELFLIEKGKMLEEDSVFMKNIYALMDKHEAVIDAFTTKNRDVLNALFKQEHFVYYHDVVDSLIARGIDVTPEEIAVLEEFKMLRTREEEVKRQIARKEFESIHGEAMGAMQTKYNYLVSEYLSMQRFNSTVNKLKEIFNVDKGLVSDIIFSQDLCRSIIEETSPLEEEILRRRLKNISDTLIAEYIVAQNELVKARIEANKLKTGYTVHTTPNIEAEQLFDAMMEKYKGKVVFVDFWATWCGPCRSANERIKPLKEELEDKAIVFVYITGPSSPEGTWNNMIPDIKGEHYRVSADEWNNLCGKFNVSGIPHYLLVDKDGLVAKNNGMPTYDLNSMKKLFEEFMAK